MAARETFDAKGNHIYYEYVGDDPALALNKVYEEHRSYNQRYLRQIYYGNLNSNVRYTDGTIVGVERQGLNHRDGVSLLRRRYVFEVVFDYGDGGAHRPPHAAKRSSERVHRRCARTRSLRFAPDLKFARCADANAC